MTTTGRTADAAPDTPSPVEHMTVSQRVAIGRAARARLPRSSHTVVEPPSERDPIAWLEEQAATRVPELVPIRYERMLASPFAFFRGAATVMAHDLAATPRTDLVAQLSGDAHLLNFGGFASPERDLVFDLNDFDETLRGPFEWDVKRLAASIEVAARNRGLAHADRSATVLNAVRAYRKQMQRLAEMNNLDVWYARVDATELVAELRAEHEAREARRVARTAARARSNDNIRAFSKLTRTVDGEPRIVSNPPLIVPISELPDGATDLETSLLEIYRSYRRTLQPDRRKLLEQYRFADLARKVVGVGSVGTRCWIILLLGRDDRDPLFLQLKEAEASVLEPHLGRSPFANHAQRVVEGQRLSQAASDIFLGWLAADDLDGVSRDFYVRQLRDWKVSIDVERILPRGLDLYSRWCGATLARAHARSGDRIAIAAYLGNGTGFEHALAEFAAKYADLNERDYKDLVRAVREGRIAASSS